MSPEIRAIKEREVERYDGLLIAAEKWSPLYKNDRDTYKRIIKAEARLRGQIRRVFRETASTVESHINWNQYSAQQAQVQASQLKAAVDVEVIVEEALYDELDALFFNLTFETISTAIAIGAQAGEAIYKIPLGIRSTDAIIQDITTERLAWLVGKRVDKEGNIVDNPKAEYRISNKTREDIASNIKTGIALGEDKAAMIKRLEDIVRNPARAEKIAQTETVNAYGSGMLQFGIESDATGKEWEDVAATDVCGDNSRQGIIPIRDKFISGDYAPAAHTGCRCNLRIVYSNEFNG